MTRAADLQPRPSPSPRCGRLVLLTLALMLTFATSTAVAEAGPPGALGGPGASVDTAASTAPFSLNLYRTGDFASQQTPYWCVGASMQMMLNIIGVTNEASRAGQERYMRVARASGPSVRQIDHGGIAPEDDEELRGAGSGGWARGLTGLGAGRYEERIFDDFPTAVRMAAHVVRATNRPVGLIVWRGAHAWVMSGFTSTGDPLRDPEFAVTGVFIQDPWYPRVSSIWGRGRDPNSWLSIAEMRKAFLPRSGGRWHPGVAGKFVIVMPVAPTQPRQGSRTA